MSKRDQLANQFLRANFYTPGGGDEADALKEAFLAGFDAGAEHTRSQIESWALDRFKTATNQYRRASAWALVEYARALPLDPKEAQDAE